jgi:hypothetical protein
MVWWRLLPRPEHSRLVDDSYHSASEMLLTTNNITRCHNADDYKLNSHSRHENLKNHMRINKLLYGI